MERWATFDCYGTLIDWDGGVRTELARVFGDDRADELLARYHEIEPELQASGESSYRQVLTESMRRLGAPAGEEHGLAESLPGWCAFPEVRATLEELRRRGWNLGILSNTDDDFIAASHQRSAQVSTGQGRSRHTAADHDADRDERPRTASLMLRPAARSRWRAAGRW